MRGAAGALVRTLGLGENTPVTTHQDLVERPPSLSSEWHHSIHLEILHVVNAFEWHPVNHASLCLCSSLLCGICFPLLESGLPLLTYFDQGNRILEFFSPGLKRPCSFCFCFQNSATMERNPGHFAPERPLGEGGPWRRMEAAPLTASTKLPDVWVRLSWTSVAHWVVRVEQREAIHTEPSQPTLWVIKWQLF